MKCIKCNKEIKNKNQGMLIFTAKDENGNEIFVCEECILERVRELSKDNKSLHTL